MESYMPMEFKKFMSEDLVVGDERITYIGYADYSAQTPITDWYEQESDKSRKIWRIKKIVENTVTKITEQYYPDADPAKTYARTDRATLNYI